MSSVTSEDSYLLLRTAVQLPYMTYLDESVIQYYVSLDIGFLLLFIPYQPFER